MTVAYTRTLNQQATYFPPGAPDGFGNVLFTDAPVVIACRWQDAVKLFRDATGQEMTTSHIVYVDRVLAIRGYLALGDVTAAAGAGGLLDPLTVNGAQEIRRFDSSPSITADLTLYKAYLT